MEFIDKKAEALERAMDDDELENVTGGKTACRQCPHCFKFFSVGDTSFESHVASCKG